MNRLAICLSIAGLALAACGSEPEPDAAAAAASRAQAARPIRWRAWRGRSVTASPVRQSSIRYDFASQPAVGTPIELQVAFIPHAGVDSMEVMVSGMDGVTLAGTLSTSFPTSSRRSPICTRCRCCRTAAASST